MKLIHTADLHIGKSVCEHSMLDEQRFILANILEVVATEKPVESEKFAFRVWLLRLGFNGAEYKAQRATLLKNLSGPAAFPNQAAADAFGAAQKEKRSATKVADSSDGLKPAQITAAVSKLAAQVSAMEEEVEA